MSSRHEIKRHERSNSRSVEHRRDWKHKSHDRTRLHSPKSSKHRSPSREKRESKNKKSKKKKRHSSSSSSSSDSGEEELKLLQRLEAERLRLKDEKKNQKEQLKANETPEEKRARRLREKQEKERKRRERMGWDNEYQCYTNQDNPFGDSALTNTFVWTKKLAKEGVKTVSRDELEALNRQKQLENKIELEKVKQRRLEREAERAARETEAAAAARARETQQFHTWARQEDAFHLHQARLRSQIRIRDGRAKPIDLLAWYVSSEECVDALEMHEPYTYLNGLQTQDLEDLLEDIKVYKELENNANQAYWEDVQTIVLDELNKLRRLAAPDARRDGVHQAVADDVTQIFKGKTGAQLEALQTQIEQKISGRHDGVDVGYWESLLSQLKAHMSRARLRDRHQSNLRRKLQLLKQEQGVQPAGKQEQGVQPAGKQEQGVQPAGKQEQGVQPAGKQEQGVQLAGKQEQGVQLAGKQEQGVQPAGKQEQGVQPAGKQEQGVQPAGKTEQGVQPAGEQEQGVQPAGKQEQGVQPAGKQEQGVQPAGKQEQGVQPAGKQEQGVQPAGKQEQGMQLAAKQEAQVHRSQSPETERPAEDDSGSDADEQCAASVALYRAGRYSPARLRAAALEPATLLTEPALDAARLAYLRAGLRARSQPAPAPGARADALEREARRAMGAARDEAPFSVEHALPEQPCLWADKYRPRKPRYFNRVHTGFEWNKYNQTHYDMDNPPPKIVQGYKFNIFYPDLIDKNATPEFSLKACPENPDFAVLRFHAGPPYEDIAFKIVNREWEYSYKRGFRCHFHNNIFQLWFHFKRYRYRR